MSTYTNKTKTYNIDVLKKTPVINTHELKYIIEHCPSSDIILLDVRSNNKFSQSHIPHSINTDYKKWRVTYNNVRDVIPNPSYLTSLFQSLGIRQGSYVIIIGGIDIQDKKNDFATTARVYWTLKVAGNHTVSILDGGFQSWINQGFETSDTVEMQASEMVSNWEVKEIDKEWLSLEQDVQEALHHSETILLDSRPEDYYNGYLKSTLKHGVTIDGSINFPQLELINNDGTIKSLEEIGEILKKYHISSEQQYIHFCNTGHMASTTWFIFSELLHIRSTLYDASLVEWTLNKKNPIKNKKPFWKVQKYNIFKKIMH